MAALIATFAGAVSISVNQRLASVHKRKRKLVGEQVANAGIQMTLKRFQEDPSFLSPNGTWRSDSNPDLALSDPSLVFEVEVYNNQSDAPVTAPDGTVLPSRQAWLRSTPIIDGVELKVATVVNRATQPQPHFLNALHVTHHRPDLANTVIAPMAGSSPGAQANVRLEESAWFNRATIDGDVLVPNEDELPVVWDPLTLTGEARVENRVYPKLQFREPEALSSAPILPSPSGGVVLPGRYGNATFTSQVTLLPGVYLFDRFVLRTDVDVVLSPLAGPANPVQIYVTNDFITGVRSQVNVAGQAASLAIYGTGDGDVWWDHTIALHSDSETTAVIAAGELWSMDLPSNFTLNGALRIGFPWQIKSSTINFDPSLPATIFSAETEWIVLGSEE